MGTPWLRMKQGTGGDVRYWRQMAIRQLKPQVKDEADAFKMYTDIANTLRGAGETQMADTMLAIARDEKRHQLTIQELIEKLEAKER